MVWRKLNENVQSSLLLYYNIQGMNLTHFLNEQIKLKALNNSAAVLLFDVPMTSVMMIQVHRGVCQQ